MDWFEPEKWDAHRIQGEFYTSNLGGAMSHVWTWSEVTCMDLNVPCYMSELKKSEGNTFGPQGEGYMSKLGSSQIRLRDLKGKATRARINSFLNLCIDCRSVRLICLKKSWSICLENHLSIKKTITQFFHQEINHFLFIKKFIKRFIIIYLDQPISIFCCNSWFFWS